MKNEQLQKALELKEKIEQLELLYHFLVANFDDKPLKIAIHTEVLGHYTVTPYTSKNENSFISDTEDGKAVLAAVKERLDLRKKEFEKL